MTKQWVTESGAIVEDDVHDIWKRRDDPVVCEYKGVGPDSLMLKNWTDSSQKDYMQVVKDDIIDTTLEGKKNDAGKPMFSCLPPDALFELGKVAELGARKYGLHNYRNGIKVSRILDAAFRHLIAAIGNEDKDPIDGNNHLASAAWNCLSALQMIKDHPNLDDRYKKEESK